MKKIYYTTLTLLLLTIMSSVRTQNLNQSDLKMLAAMMAGRYSSEAQAKSDTNFLHISLNMEPVWTERTDGYWLYVEQALASRMDKPYRQRIYHLQIVNKTTIASKVYEIPNPEQYIGAWKEKSKLENLSAGDLIDRQGCSIFLQKTGRKKFAGSTPGKECLSSLRGATYATSEVLITSRRLISWDRGWNLNDEQVWGSEFGGYIFKKVSR